MGSLAGFPLAFAMASFSFRDALSVAMICPLNTMPVLIPFCCSSMPGMVFSVTYRHVWYPFPLFLTTFEICEVYHWLRAVASMSQFPPS